MGEKSEFVPQSETKIRGRLGDFRGGSLLRRLGDAFRGGSLLSLGDRV